MIEYHKLAPFLTPSVPGLERPFSWGSHTYLTNGQVAVRILRVSSVEEMDQYSTHAEQVDNLLDFCERSAPAPLVLPEERFDCHVCMGFGWTVDCEACMGSGELLDGVDCPDCNGLGVIPAYAGDSGVFRCGNCYGLGEELRELSVMLRLRPETHLDPSVALLLESFDVREVQIQNDITKGGHLEEWVTFQIPELNAEGCVPAMRRYSSNIQESFDAAMERGLPA